METTSGISCTESFSRDVVSRVMAFYVLSHFLVMVFSRDVISRVMAFYILSHFLVMSFSRYDVTDHEAYPPMSTHGRVTETSGVASVYLYDFYFSAIIINVLGVFH